MKRILFLISLSVAFNEVQAQKRAVPTNPFSQTLKALQAERLHNENLKAQKAPSLDKLLLFRKYSFAKIENILTNEGWQYISGEDINKGSLATFAYNTTVDNKAWYKLSIGYANNSNEDTGNAVSFEHDSKLINKNIMSRLYALNYKLKFLESAQDGIGKMLYNYSNKTFVLMMNENNNTGYGQHTKYKVIIGLSTPAKRDSIENVPNIKY